MKFRIDISDVTLLPDIQKAPTEESATTFQKTVKKFMVEDDESPAEGWSYVFDC